MIKLTVESRPNGHNPHKIVILKDFDGKGVHHVIPDDASPLEIASYFDIIATKLREKYGDCSGDLVG